MENPKTPTTSPLNNPKTAINSPLEKLTSPDVSPLKIPKSPLLNPNYYDDEFCDSYENDYSSVETDSKLGRELDSEGELIYTSEPDLYQDREYSSVDAFFSNNDCEDKDWLEAIFEYVSVPVGVLWLMMIFLI